MRAAASGAARSRALGFSTSTGPIPVWIGANRMAPMPNDALAPVGQREGGMHRSHEGLEFRLNRLGDQPTRARAQNFGEWIVDFAFLPEGDNSILIMA